MLKSFSLNNQKTRNIFLFNGNWEFAFSNSKKIPNKFSSQIIVPSLVDSSNSPLKWDDFKYFFYKYDFSIDNLNNKLFYFLKLYHSMYGTNVWLNGKYIGENISCYTSQNYDLSKFIKKNNILVIRIGRREDLPKHSAVGIDLERSKYIPGIWGDVELIVHKSVKINHVLISPNCEEKKISAEIELKNLNQTNKNLKLIFNLREKKTKKLIATKLVNDLNFFENRIKKIKVEIKFNNFKYWSLENPFLYELETIIDNYDSVQTTFGMREFKIKNGGFYLNAERIFLKGGNIAFHRFLSDTDRKLLPWDLNWVKKLLIAIPKKNNFNFFRNHLGQMYHKWYDIADEYGILIQNEWQFWGVTGSINQIKKEFSEWIIDNFNHPSIIIWDPINESSSLVLQKKIIPNLRKLDTTRPWESIDFIEEHPYIYSLCMTKNNRKIGFTRSLNEIENDKKPKMFNEFLWWWMDKNYNPTKLMDGVIERWLGKNYTKKDFIDRQSFLARELIEMFRRMRIDAIQPFVYLSNSDGPTGNWFNGNIKNLNSKPILNELKKSFSPLGVSIEILDRHFYINEKRKINVHIFNDSNINCKINLHWGVKNKKEIIRKNKTIDIKKLSSKIENLDFNFPNKKGRYNIFSEVYCNDKLIDKSIKIANVYEEANLELNKNISIIDNEKNILKYFKQKKIKIYSNFQSNVNSDLFIFSRKFYENKLFIKNRKQISERVKSGTNLILIEPEFEIKKNTNLTLFDKFKINIVPRNDFDKGGYDSYFFAENIKHPIWKSLKQIDFNIFNGKYGGEIVSEHNITINQNSNVLAACGLGLKIPVIIETEYGNGKIVICRLQISDRIANLNNGKNDPVLQKILLNMISYYAK